MRGLKLCEESHSKMASRRSRMLVNCFVWMSNFLLIVMAGLTIAVACLALVDTNLLNGHLTPLVQMLPSGNGLGFSLFTIYHVTVFSFFVFGGMACVLGIIGCVIIGCRSRPIVVFYLLSLALLMVGQITGAIMLINMDISEDLGLNLFRHLVVHYTGDDGTDVHNVAWNFAMVEYSCCGANSYEDFESTTLWNRAEFVGGNLTSALIPVTCCKLSGKYPEIGLPLDSNCTFYPTANNSFIFTPCREKIEDYLDYYQTLMVGCSSLLGVMEIMAMGSMILVSREFTRRKMVEKFKHPDMLRTIITGDYL